MKIAKDLSDFENLHVYQHGVAKVAIFADQFKRIGLIPRGRVRLGHISFNGEQKGVAQRLGLDLGCIA